MTTVGILAIGRFLPPEVRTNEFWPKQLVDTWIARRRATIPSPLPKLSASGERIVAAMAQQQDDPFQGAVSRHVLAATMTSHDMELSAARDAIDRAAIDPQSIDLVITHTVTPEYLLSNTACPLHLALGLPPACLAMQIEGAAYAFLTQLAIAEAMIVAGRARYALLVQSCIGSRLVEPDDVVSPYFGDGATAVVVGPVSSRGLLGAVHYTDGHFPKTLVAAVKGGTWYDGGRDVIHIGDPEGMRAVLLQTVDLCKTSVDAALAKAGCAPADIDFFCIHQGTPWLRQLAQEYAGLASAATVETFAETGYMFSSIMPLGLRKAEETGLLAAGDLVALFGGGTGMIYGATVMAWGA